MNKIIAGDYQGQGVYAGWKGVSITCPFFDTVPINRNTVSAYEVLDADSRKSAVSALSRALIGSMLVGPIGAMAGLSAKSKGTYLIAIQFRDGKQSLLQVDNNVYKAILKALFGIKLPPVQENCSRAIPDTQSVPDTQRVPNIQGAEPPSVQENRSENTPNPQSEETPPPLRENVKVFRKPRMLACAAVYQIMLDDVHVGAVKNGETVSIPAGTGKHTLSFFNKGALNPRKPLATFDFSVESENNDIEIEIETKSLSTILVTKKQ